MEKLLEEIRDLSLPRQNLSVVLSSRLTDWTTHFSPPMYLDPKRQFETALVNLEMYNSIPNITSENNTFVYGPAEGIWRTITIPQGSYEIAQINGAIQHQLMTNGDWDAGEQKHFIRVGANPATLRATVCIANNSYKIDMAKSTLRTVLGFDAQVLSKGYFEGERPVDIMQVNAILVNTDLITGSYLNGGQSQVIYSFFPEVSPGFKIVDSPNNLVFLPVAQKGDIGGIRVWLTDQNGKQLDIQGETITVRFHIRSI